VTAGLALAGFGGRVTWLPFEGRRGKRHGLDTGLTLFADPAGLELMAMYAWTLPTAYSAR